MSVFKSMKEGDSFNSFYEYDCLLRAIEDAEGMNLIEEIPVAAQREVPQVEHWYREKSTGDVYSLRPPEFPARGYWGPVLLAEFRSPEGRVS